jgi:ribosomal protein S1
MAWKKAAEYLENETVLDVKVAGVVNAGVVAYVEGLRGFIPASKLALSFVENLEEWLHKEIQVRVITADPAANKLVLSAKEILREKADEERRNKISNVAVGLVTEGTVERIQPYGAFIDLGGADGLLHISEMSWGRVEHPKKVFKIGDKVNVLIKEINGSKIALSLKFDDANPWKDAAAKYAVGTEVTGTVARMTDFGAFVELEPGVDALLHVSQISKEHVEKPADVLKVGDEVTAKVVDFNEADKKISLSVKAMFAPEPAAEAVVEEDADVVSIDIDAVIASEETAE